MQLRSLSPIALAILLGISLVIVYPILATVSGVPGPVPGPRLPPSGLLLSNPQLLLVASAHSPLQDASLVEYFSGQAGISAYAQANQPIDLAKAANLFRTLDQQTDEYLVGSVTPPGYEDRVELRETADVHVFVHKDGWVVAYLLEWENTAQIIDWLAYGQSKLNNTTLSATISKIFSSLGLGVPSVGYYDFRYPHATELRLIADVEQNGQGKDEFRVEVPSTLEVFDRTWAVASTGSANCQVNDKELGSVSSGGNQWQVKTGPLQPALFLQGQANTFLIKNGGYNVPSYCGIALVFREAQ